MEIDIDYPENGENGRFDMLEMVLASFGDEIEKLAQIFK